MIKTTKIRFLVFRQQRRQHTGCSRLQCDLGVGGDKTRLFSVWEKMSAVWEFYSLSEKNPWVRRVGGTFQGEMLHLRIFKHQISSTTWKQTWGRIQYRLKRVLKNGEVNWTGNRNKTATGRIWCLISTAFEKGKKKCLRTAPKLKGVLQKATVFRIMTGLSQQWTADFKVWWWVWSHTSHWPATVCRAEIYLTVASHINELLATVASPVSMLSLIAQWVGKDFKLIKEVVHPQKFTGSHLLSLRPLRKCLKDGK